MPNLDLKGYSLSVPRNIATKLLPFALYSILITLAVAMRLIFFCLLFKLISLFCCAAHLNHSHKALGQLRRRSSRMRMN